MFRPARTVVFEVDLENVGSGVEAENNAKNMQLLHEVGHALLGHRDYTTDPERLKMERAAWTQAQELCVRYEVEYNEELVEAELDTYRDWLHRRSKCPECGLTRFQTRDGKYHCPQCDEWV